MQATPVHSANGYGPPPGANGCGGGPTSFGPQGFGEPQPPYEQSNAEKRFAGHDVASEGFGEIR